MANALAAINHFKSCYWPLFKSRQTFMLTITGLAGYLCASNYPPELSRFFGLAGSLLLTISGSTVLNMLFDRDIDRKMWRTRQRPLALELVQPRTALILGLSLIFVGLIWSAVLSPFYLAAIIAGVGLNVLVYTLWLKRRSAWSIMLGGVAGGIPILAGRILATGKVDLLGIFLALAVIHWIPSHNLTLNMLYAADYLDAGVPTIPNTYGSVVSHLLITYSSLMTALFVALVGSRLALSSLVMVILYLTSLGLVSLAGFVLIKPSYKVINVLFKYSSLYMLVTMLVLALSGMT